MGTRLKNPVNFSGLGCISRLSKYAGYVGMYVRVGEFKGKKVISLLNSEDEKFPFTFGVKKAKMILEAIEYIQAFVDRYDVAKEVCVEEVVS